MNNPGDDLKARLRFWWAGQPVVLGLGLAFVLAAILGFVAVIPTGPTKMVAGTIENFGLTESETGSYPVAVVRLPDREVTVALPRSNTCVVGSTIRLQRQERVWGQMFISDWAGCGRG